MRRGLIFRKNRITASYADSPKAHNLLAAINARDAKITGVRTEVIGTLADAPARFIALDLCISADSPDRQLLEKLVEIAARACIMLNTLQAKVELRVRAAEPV